jgi:hypothetical protein
VSEPARGPGPAPPDVIYRVVFETVKQECLRKYTDADPALYSGTSQAVPNSKVPDEDWEAVCGKPTDDPWSQFYCLRKWADEDREFVRAVRLEAAVLAGLEWETVPR